MDEDIPTARDMQYPDSYYLDALSAATRAGLPGNSHELIRDIFGFAMHLGEEEAFAAEELDEILQLEAGTCEKYTSALPQFIDIGENPVPPHISEFLGDPMRAGSFYINSVEMINKHVKNCLRYISMCRPKSQLDFGTLYIAIMFFDENQAKIIFDHDHEEIMANFSVLNCCKPVYDNKNAVINQTFVPLWLHLLKRSNKEKLFLYHQKKLDMDYRQLLPDYYNNERLSLALAIVLHFSLIYDDDHPSPMPGVDSALNDGLSLIDVHSSEDLLGILRPTPTAHNMKVHNDLLSLYLRNSQRSGPFSLQRSGGLLHANAALTCLDYLSRINVANWRLKVEDHDMDADDSEQGSCADGEEPERTPWIGEVEDNYLDVLATFDEEDDRLHVLENSYMDAWRRDWKRANREKDSDKWQYLLALGFALFFLPRAGISEDLLEMCNTSYQRLPSDGRTYSHHIRNIDDLMAVYIKRWAGRQEGISPSDGKKSIYPLKKARMSVYTGYEEECQTSK
ncbi:hypothetical protein D9613_010751 [Agrocybe pediades]|uniref:Uncharacterized protein n=1 Tax=Agrocybe pediades TaxID=84607 RepID=A0A8H4QLV0_9AGAR|nr:hypothetical protein D9613_010751 [Agrocybe pediades]